MPAGRSVAGRRAIDKKRMIFKRKRLERRHSRAVEIVNQCKNVFHLAAFRLPGRSRSADQTYNSLHS